MIAGRLDRSKSRPSARKGLFDHNECRRKPRFLRPLAGDLKSLLRPAAALDLGVGCKSPGAIDENRASREGFRFGQSLRPDVLFGPRRCQGAKCIGAEERHAGLFGSSHRLFDLLDARDVVAPGRHHETHVK